VEKTQPRRDLYQDLSRHLIVSRPTVIAAP